MKFNLNASYTNISTMTSLGRKFCMLLPAQTMIDHFFDKAMLNIHSTEGMYIMKVKSIKKKSTYRVKLLWVTVYLHGCQ